MKIGVGIGKVEKGVSVSLKSLCTFNTWSLRQIYHFLQLYVRNFDEFEIWCRSREISGGLRGDSHLTAPKVTDI